MDYATTGNYYNKLGMTYVNGDPTSAIKRCHSYNCEVDGDSSGASQVTYTSHVWFTDDEVYEYPYCKSDYNYFDYTELKDHSLNWDEGEPCTLYEHRTGNYKQCEPNYPGFISPTAEDTPTEDLVGNDRKYFSALEEDGFSDYTGIVLKECP